MKIWQDVCSILGKGSVGFYIIFCIYAINESGLWEGIWISLTYVLVLFLIGSVISLIESLIKLRRFKKKNL